MSIFAVGDLHLSSAAPKPMDIFGIHWSDHWQKIKEHWINAVSEDDLVLMPGDLSWAMKLSDAAADLDEICSLSGTKLIIKGNHDYWWSSLSQVNSLLSNNAYALQNNSFSYGEYVIAGSRGWVCPSSSQYDPGKDEKLYIREAGRLELSLKHAKQSSPDAKIIGMLHFPPSDKQGTKTLYTDLFELYNVQQVVYGHLHAGSISSALSGTVRGVKYTLVSCDATGFKLVKIA
jgi:predicted phosphohydrolase